MSRSEIAMQLTLALIEKGSYRIGDSIEETGQNVAELYNAIICNLDCRAEGSRKD